MSIVDPFTLKLYSVTEPRGRELLKAYIATYMDGGSKRKRASASALASALASAPAPAPAPADCDTNKLFPRKLGEPKDIIRFFLSDVKHDTKDLMNYYC